MSAPEPKEQEENTINEYSELGPQVKESREDVKIDEDQVSPVLPENETEEKEEILLTPTVEPVKPKMRQHKISPADAREQLERQTTKIDKIRTLLQSILKDTKSIQVQSKSIKQLQSQLKQLQNQLTQIHKIITKKGFTIGITHLKKKRQILKG